MLQLLLVTTLALVTAFAAPEALQASNSMDFEGGVDGEPIASTITGVRFTNDGASRWLFGNIDNPRYAVPPHTVNGRGFAWVGEASGSGRIDFVDQQGTRYAASFSTADELTMEAFDEAGQLLSKRTISPNLGRLDRIEVEAIGPRLIAYVTIKAQPGRWLMDDMEAEVASVVPIEQTNRDQPPAQLTLVQRSSPSLGVTPGSKFDLTLVATNRGRGTARNILVRLPLEAGTVQVLDARFSRSSAWVRTLTSDEAVINLGALGSNETVTTTISLLVASQASPGTALGVQAVISWADATGRGMATSNRPPVTVMNEMREAATLPLEVAITQGAATTYTVSSQYFHPLEPISLWYDKPDGKSVALGTYQADADGLLRAVVQVNILPKGVNPLVASGLWSGLNATSVVSVP